MLKYNKRRVSGRARSARLPRFWLTLMLFETRLFFYCWVHVSERVPFHSKFAAPTTRMVKCDAMRRGGGSGPTNSVACVRNTLSLSPRSRTGQWQIQGQPLEPASRPPARPLACPPCLSFFERVCVRVCLCIITTTTSTTAALFSLARIEDREGELITSQFTGRAMLLKEERREELDWESCLRAMQFSLIFFPFFSLFFFFSWGAWD